MTHYGALASCGFYGGLRLMKYVYGGLRLIIDIGVHVTRKSTIITQFVWPWNNFSFIVKAYRYLHFADAAIVLYRIILTSLISHHSSVQWRSDGAIGADRPGRESEGAAKMGWKRQKVVVRTAKMRVIIRHQAFHDFWRRQNCSLSRAPITHAAPLPQWSVCLLQRLHTDMNWMWHLTLIRNTIKHVHGMVTYNTQYAYAGCIWCGMVF